MKGAISRQLSAISGQVSDQGVRLVLSPLFLVLGSLHVFCFVEFS
jgi:hypothetical protein